MRGIEQKEQKKRRIKEQNTENRSRLEIGGEEDNRKSRRGGE